MISNLLPKSAPILPKSPPGRRWGGDWGGEWQPCIKYFLIGNELMRGIL